MPYLPPKCYSVAGRTIFPVLGLNGEETGRFISYPEDEARKNNWNCETVQPIERTEKEYLAECQFLR